MVSVASTIPAAALGAALFVSACAGRQHPVAYMQDGVSTDSNTGAVEAERRHEVLQFDNQATVYVDVYLVAGQMQWRLGRVPAGMRTMLSIPESAINWTTEVVRLAVLPGSPMSAEASRDPRAILAIAQPVSEVLSQQWTFRQPAGAPLQLQAMPLLGRDH
jgi:hypothetical protein